MQSPGARIDGDGVASANVLGKAPFNSFGLGAGGDPTRSQRIHHPINLGLSNGRLIEGQKILTHWCVSRGYQ
jgi:hypothetical protein